MSTGLSGTGSYLDMNGFNRRVTAAQSDPEKTQAPARIETPQEKRMREWDEGCAAEARRVNAERDRNLAQRQQEKARTQSELQRQQAQAAWEMNERLIDGVFEQAGLTREEIAAVTQRMVDSGKYNVEWATYLTAETVASRQAKAKSIVHDNSRIASVHDMANRDEWNEIQQVLGSNLHGFTPQQVASGEAHEKILRWIRTGE